MNRWEYLQLAWFVWVKGEGESAKWMESAYIYRAGREPEKLVEQPMDGQRWNSLEVVSDLGSQGWELVTLEARNGAYIPGEGQGYHATPVDRRWWFKRPIP